MATNKKQVGIVAVSAPCERERFGRGVAALQSHGFEVRIAGDPCAEYGSGRYLFSSASIEARCAAIHELFSAPDVDCILAARGGAGAIELLPHLDYELIKANPKPLLGFSDVTALLVALSDKCGTPVVHAPSLESAWSKLESSSLAKESALAEANYINFGSFSGLESTQLVPLVTMTDTLRQTEGSIIGGNLSVLVALVGTEWFPSLDGKLLFLEETNERPHRIHRALLQLKLADHLSRLKGVLLGDFINCTHPDPTTPNWQTVVRSVFEPLNIPVYGGVQSGHGELNMPVPFNKSIRITSTGTIEFSARS